MIFDTHAHYDDEQFNEDRVELLNSMEEQGVGTIVNVSAAYNSCRKVIALAKEYPFVYAAVGIHPDEVGSLNEETFAHYDDEQFNEDRVELLNSMEEQGVGTIVNVSAAYNSCRKVIALAKEYPFVYAAVGIHPDEVGSLNEETFAQMKELFKEDKVVAVGEIGLDYYWDNEPREVQKKWFIRQLELARELDLPVLIHSREAAADTMEIMKEHAKGLSGVIHCYSYSKEMAQEYIKMGFYKIEERR